MSQNFGPFGATAPETSPQSNIPTNPFGNVQIPDTPPNGFTAPESTAPPTPDTGVVQTQNSGFNMNTVMSQPTTGSEDAPVDISAATNAFTNMVSNQPNTSGSPFVNVQIPPVTNPAPTMPVTNPMPNMPVTHPTPGFTQPQFSQPMTQPQQSPFNPGYNNNNNQQLKYNITDLFWLINPKFMNNNLGNESQMVIVSYNADFNNLALRFTAINQFASPSALCVKDLARQGTVNLYSEHCMELLSLQAGQNMRIIERAFNLNNWHPNNSIFNKIDDNTILVQSVDMNNQQYAFTFTGWQYLALHKALDFMLSGSSWLISLQCRTNR